MACNDVAVPRCSGGVKREEDRRFSQRLDRLGLLTGQPAQPAQFLPLGRRQLARRPLTAVGLVLPDPVPQPFGADPELPGDLGDGPAGGSGPGRPRPA